MRVTNRNRCSIIPGKQLLGQVDFAETTETETPKVLHTLSQYYLRSCLHRGFIIPVSAPVLSVRGYLCSSIKVAYSVARSVCSFIYSRSGHQDCIIISPDLLLARMKTCCQSRSNGHYRTRNGQTERKSTVRQLSAYSGGTKFSLPLPSM